MKDKDGFTPLHRCCQEPPPPASKPKNEEVEAEKIELTAEEKSQNDCNRSEIVKLLVAKGADVNARESKGDQRPLHLAAINGYAFVCQ